MKTVANMYYTVTVALEADPNMVEIMSEGKKSAVDDVRVPKPDNNLIIGTKSIEDKRQIIFM